MNKFFLGFTFFLIPIQARVTPGKPYVPFTIASLLQSCRERIRIASESYKLYHDLKNNSSLIDSNIDFNIKDYKGWTPLFWAIYNNDINNVKLLISKINSLNEIDEYGLTPLMIAAKNGYATIVETLIEHGAIMNNKVLNHKKDPFLLHVMRENSYKVNFYETQTLKTIEKDSNTNTHYGNLFNNALILAIVNYHFEVVQILLKAGAEFNNLDHDNTTALDICLSTEFKTSTVYDASGRKNTNYNIKITKDKLKMNPIIDLLINHGCKRNNQVTVFTTCVGYWSDFNYKSRQVDY